MSNKPIVCRVSMIPGGDVASRESELRTFIDQSLLETEKQHLSAIRISVVRSCYDPQMFTALVDFPGGLPAFLKPLQQNPLQPLQLGTADDDIDLEFDLHFHGLTQLYNPIVDPSETTMDVVAITDGHAYGSWRGGNLGRMWLRDFLRKDLPRCRVMIYGYNAKLSEPGLHTISLFGRSLREELLKARRTDQERRKPIIFITHSFGGIILIDCLMEATFPGADQGLRDLADATYGFLFFGTPHRGLPIEDMKCMIEDNMCHSRNDLLSDINTGSRLLEQQLSRFKNWIGDRKIVSFIETQATRRLQKQPDGTWARKGEHVTAVARDSALVQLPDNVEEKIAVEGNHSTMVKFGSKNHPAYGSALDRLRTFEREAKDVVEKRFCPPAGLTGSLVHFIVPYSRNERFIAGDQNLGRIKEKLAAQKSSHHRRLAIYGLGGVGKTQDVLEYVYTFKDSPVSVFWVHAGSTARFEQDYRKLARAVELPGWDDAKKDIRPIVKEWLESPKSGNWILVLDNADNAANFFSTDESTASDGLASFVPQGAKGTVVVTTRTREVADQLAGMNILSKDVMETDQAEQLFIQHYPATTDHERESILLLLRVLHNLPLAIIHVAAYLRRNPTFSPSKYINLFNSTRDSQMHFLSKPFSDLRREATAETVLATFSITFRQIQEQSPLSGSLLKLIACIDRQSIPHELLADSGFEGANDEFTLNEAISKLLNFSLLTTVQNGSAYEIHSLVHVSIAAFLTQRQEMDAVQRWTAELFARLLRNDEVHNWPFWRVYFPHASALASRITKDADTLHTAAIYDLMSEYLLAIGRYREAEGLARKSTKVRTHLLGQEHPATLISMDNLAMTYWKQGRLREAEELNVKVMQTRKRVLGQEHPDTLTSMNDLASTYLSQGRLREAEELEVKVMQTRKRVLGQEHPVTLISMNNLAWTYKSQGWWREAEELQVKVMQTRKRVLGQEHPDTLTSMNDLASTYWNQGRLREAEELNVKVMQTRKRVLGQEHPATLTSMKNLAWTWKSQGRVADAIVMMTEVANLGSSLLGRDHPHTSASMSTLKEWRDGN